MIYTRVCNVKVQKVKLAVGNEKKNEAENKLVIYYTTNNNSNILRAHNLSQGLF